VFQSQFDFAKFSTQIHDFDLGFGPALNSTGGNGFGDRLFWTTAIPDSDVQVNLGAGKAEMDLTNLALPDYPRIPIALGSQFQTAYVPGTISFDVVWQGPVTRRLNVANGTNGDQFAGEFVENDATVTWSASNANGFTFQAKPGDLSTSIPGRAFVGLSHEENGTFFPTASDAAGSASSSTIAEPLFPVMTVASMSGGTNRSLASLSAGGSAVALTGSAHALASTDAGQAVATSAALERAFDYLADPADASPFLATAAGQHSVDRLFL
jgi:hypothetical protein